MTANASPLASSPKQAIEISKSVLRHPCSPAALALPHLCISLRSQGGQVFDDLLELRWRMVGRSLQAGCQDLSHFRRALLGREAETCDSQRGPIPCDSDAEIL